MVKRTDDLTKDFDEHKIDKKEANEKWPCYVLFDNKTIMIFDFDIPRHLITRKTELKIVSSGRVETNRWACWNKSGRDTEATLALRKLLTV